MAPSDSSNASTSVPEPTQEPPTNHPFPAPVTGFRDYVVDAIVTWHRHDHDTSDYDHDFDEPYARRNAEHFVDQAIQASTTPQCPHPDVEKRTATEVILARVRALAERWKYTSDRKDGPLRELVSALDEDQP